MTTDVHCTFVHGWAMNSAFWDELLPLLPSWLKVTMVDLPGHGSMAQQDFRGLDEVAQVLAALDGRPNLWVGWSMGALAVLRLAERYPQRVAGALLVAANPCFVRRPDWAHGVPAEVFQNFAAELRADQKKTLRRFLALQVRGTDNAMALVRRLQQALDQRGMASATALDAGLEVLLHSDFRPFLAALGRQFPLHWLLGGKDALVPASLAQSLDQDYGQPVRVIAEAGHAPFLSHPQAFADALLALAGEIRQDTSAGAE